MTERDNGWLDKLVEHATSLTFDDVLFVQPIQSVQNDEYLDCA